MSPNRRDERPKWPHVLHGGAYVARLDELLRSLRSEEAHGNRTLHFDDVLVCYLLAFFNPAIRSLRTVEDFSRTRQAARFLSVERIPKSTLADFHKVADVKLLQPIVDLLRGAVERSCVRPATALPETLKKVLAVDGSFFNVAADVAWAFKKRGGKSAGKGGRPRRAARLDVHLDVATWIPEVVSVADGESEAASAAASVVPGAIHVYDRGIFSFDLVEAHAARKANFVVRLRRAGPRTTNFEADEELPASDQDRDAGVVSDRMGRLTGSARRDGPKGRLREVVITSPDDPDGEIRLLTDLTDLPAWVIGLIYRHRWQIELFFRWLKSCARFRWIWSEHRDAVLLQFHVCLIATLLTHLRTGMRPSKYAMNLLAMVVAGTATWEEIRPILADRDRERRLDRERLARKKARAPC